MQHFRKGQTDFRSTGKDCTEQGLPKNFVITTKRALESFMKVRILHVLELSTAHSSGQLTTTLLKTLAVIKGSAQIATINNLALTLKRRVFDETVVKEKALLDGLQLFSMHFFHTRTAFDI